MMKFYVQRMWVMLEECNGQCSDISVFKTCAWDGFNYLCLFCTKICNKNSDKQPCACCSSYKIKCPRCPVPHKDYIVGTAFQWHFILIKNLVQVKMFMKVCGANSNESFYIWSIHPFLLATYLSDQWPLHGCCIRKQDSLISSIWQI